jgi:hypothetical protein
VTRVDVGRSDDHQVITKDGSGDKSRFVPWVLVASTFSSSSNVTAFLGAEGRITSSYYHIRNTVSRLDSLGEETDGWMNAEREGQIV